MNYFIKRDLTEFGPYTLAELQRYVASGNVLLTDSCRSDGMTDWMPVSQVIGTIPVPAAAQAPTAAAQASLYPPPPGLHWGLVLLLTVLTCGIFHWVWGIVQASWMKKVQPSSKAMIYYIVALALFAFLFVTIATPPGPVRALGRFANLGGSIVWLVGALTLYLFPPEENTFYPQCPIFRLTHLYCPGCGATRALAALLHGRLTEALHYNALLVLLLPFLLVYFAGVYWNAVKRNQW